MIELRYNPIAISDLEEIKEYISQDNEEAAIRITKELIEKTEPLINFPEMGISLSKKIGIKNRYRYLVCKQYVIFYIFEDQTVNIMRILHAKRDYLKLLDL
jgi:addiction module RelE/StbE family toxin